jgi:hypothetical protein
VPDRTIEFNSGHAGGQDAAKVAGATRPHSNLAAISSDEKLPRVFIATASELCVVPDTPIQHLLHHSSSPATLQSAVLLLQLKDIWHDLRQRAGSGLALFQRLP